MKPGFPYVPNMDDCKMIVKSHGATCYIMDTCCKNITPEQRLQAEREIIRIHVAHELRRMAAEGA